MTTAWKVFFQKIVTEIYIQQCFHSYIGREENKKLFAEVKDLYNKEWYLDLKEFENRQTVAKIRLTCHKFAPVTAKWYNTKLEEQNCKLCNQGQVENNVLFHFHCSKYENARKLLPEKLGK